MITDEQLKKSIAKFYARRPIDATYANSLEKEILQLRARIEVFEKVKAAIIEADRQAKELSWHGKQKAMKIDVVFGAFNYAVTVICISQSSPVADGIKTCPKCGCFLFKPETMECANGCDPVSDASHMPGIGEVR